MIVDFRQLALHPPEVSFLFYGSERGPSFSPYFRLGQTLYGVYTRYQTGPGPDQPLVQAVATIFDGALRTVLSDGTPGPELPADDLKGPFLHRLFYTRTLPVPVQIRSYAGHRLPNVHDWMFTGYALEDLDGNKVCFFGTRSKVTPSTFPESHLVFIDCHSSPGANRQEEEAFFQPPTAPVPDWSTIAQGFKPGELLFQLPRIESGHNKSMLALSAALTAAGGPRSKSEPGRLGLITTEWDLKPKEPK